MASFGVVDRLDVEGGHPAISPIDGTELAKVHLQSNTEVKATIDRSTTAAEQWRKVPAPERGELVRLLGNKLRQHKEPLSQVVAYENGKIMAEARGEVQEMIDICDFAVGLSRQLYGLTIASERPQHSLRENWHPLGVCAVITAFNFPVAVWSWNAALALVCGNSVIWKPSEKTPLTAMAVSALAEQVRLEAGAPEGVMELCLGDATAGKVLVNSAKVNLVSATGSTRMGRSIGQAAAERFAKVILELGGNNAMIVAPSADLELAVRAIVFSAVGTAGQRCTTLRRLIVHKSIYDEVIGKVRLAYQSLPIGSPLDEATLVGPLIDEDAFNNMVTALDAARGEGGVVTGGQRVKTEETKGGYYVQPAIVESAQQLSVSFSETFAPILYVTMYEEFDDAIAMNNAVPQGLSSSVFTNDFREAELFCSAVGSDCGLANVNAGPSGAEIGGAFGGEKETGGGRESGSDAWKAYMRRQTNTLNYSNEMPLAQGITFGDG